MGNFIMIFELVSIVLYFFLKNVGGSISHKKTLKLWDSGILAFDFLVYHLWSDFDKN